MGTATPVSEQVLVIGMDGADRDIIEPLMEQGELPNLERLVDGGRSGNLTTTLPIESPVAWTTMTTGVSPGKHGIYGFLERRGDTFVPTTADDVRVDRVWDRAGEHGEVVVVNVPQTFPPQPVNGSLIGGYLSIAEEGYTYPDGLQSEIEEEGYRIVAREGGYEADARQAFLDGANETAAKRTEIAADLLARHDWTLGFVVYTGLDRIQHYYWRDMDGDGGHPDAVQDHYRQLDEELGDLLAHADENTTVMVVSDHGFGPLEKNVYLNTWLRQEGYLQVGSGGGGGGLLASLGLTQQAVVDVLGRFGLLQPVKSAASFLGFNPGTRLPDPDLSDINVSESLAYAGNYGGKIYLTDRVEGREQLLAELERKLLDITDPETGEAVFTDVHRASEFYTGGAEGAPDLLLEPAGPYRAVGFLGHRDVVGDPPEKSGTHRRDGIYVVNGPGVDSGDADAHITDVAPTILHVLGMEADEMDGRSLLD